MFDNLPQHLVAIPDGNRRWARERGLVEREGHRVGMERFREIKDAVFRVGIPHFTFWGASYDNLTKRSKLEVRFLVYLFRKELRRELKEKTFVRDEARVRILGEWRRVVNDKKLNEMADRLEKESEHFTKRNFTLLLGYDGKREMQAAVRRIAAESGIRNKELMISYETIKKYLWTGELPAVDFVIRTGGEPHWSAGFMMWHTTDSQLYFTETYWPAFKEKDLKKALAEYAKRGRRFGK